MLDPDFFCIMGGAVLGLVVAVTFHELGHLACAILVGLPVARISIGVGRVLLRRQVGLVDVRLHALPAGGFVRLANMDRPPRLRLLVFILGGILANVALIGVLAVVDSVVPMSRLARFSLVYVVMGQQAWIILLTLVPFRLRVKGMPFSNDGMQAIELLRGRHAVDTHPSYLELLRRYSGDGSLQLTAASDRIIRQFTMGEMWVVPAARREVVEALRRELATTGMSAPERLMVLDLLISIGLICDDAEMRPHLDDWAREAGELGPDVIAVSGSLAAVVVAHGRFREGKAMLEAVAAKIAAASSDANRVDDIYIQLFIARAEAGLGEASAARRRLAEAHKALKSEPRFAHLRPLAARIEREVDAASDQAAASTSISASRSGMSTITS